MQKNKGASSKHSRDIPFLQFFQRISIGRKIGWSDQRDWFLSVMLKLWQIENFTIGNFLVCRVGWQNNGWIIAKRCSRMRTCERDLHTKFQFNRPKIAEVIPFFYFWLVGWLGRSACTDFSKSIIFKAAYPKVLPCKRSRQ